MERIKLAGLFPWLFQPNPGPSSRVLRAGAWSLIGRVSIRDLAIIRTIFLARLLSPEDFGVIGIALVAWYFLDLLTNAGFDAALVRRKGDIRAYLDTAWSFSLDRGVLIARRCWLEHLSSRPFSMCPAPSPLCK